MPVLPLEDALPERADQDDEAADADMGRDRPIESDPPGEYDEVDFVLNHALYQDLSGEYDSLQDAFNEAEATIADQKVRITDLTNDCIHHEDEYANPKRKFNSLKQKLDVDSDGDSVDALGDSGSNGS